jgi:hypothetical protein
VCTCPCTWHEWIKGSGDTSLGKKNTENNIWPIKRKWCVEDLHQSNVDESVKRTRYFRDL